MLSLTRLSLPIILVILIGFAPASAAAQSSTDAVAPQSAALLKPEQLEQLAAPIALYPDTLLAQVLMAATYPLEVVAAERFVSANKNLKPDELKAQVEKKNWDKSVVALVAAPEVLKMMSDKIDWTQRIGDALLAQQADLMDAIQQLRQRAKAQDKLATTKEQVVSTRQDQDKEVIVIEPADPETIYVPYYDPAVVYGAWPYAAYPPYWFPWPGYIGRGIIAAGIGFGAGYALGRWTSGGNYWGGSVNWGNNNININRPINIGDRDRVQHFSHNPAHRHGVKYPQQLQQKFASRPGGDAGQRLDFRGRDGQQVIRPDQGGPGRDRPGGDRPGVEQRPGGDRPGAGQRPGGDRPGAAQRPAGNRPSAGNRPGGGDRPGAAQRPAGGARPNVDRPGGGRPHAGQRPSGGHGGGAFADIDRGGGAARAQAARGHASVAARGGGGGGPRVSVGGGGGGPRGGGGRGGGGRRSDVALKHDVSLLGYLDNGLGYYRFKYLGSDRVYVGVMAQEVRAVRPDAVSRGRDGYLRVRYDKLGVKFQTYERWIAEDARVPAGTRAAR